MRSNSRDAFVGADDDEHVSGAQHFFGPGRGEHISSRTIATIDAPVRVRALRVARAAGPTNGLCRGDLDLSGIETGHLAGEVGEPLRDPRRAEDLRQGLGLVLGEPKHLGASSGSSLAVEHHFEVAAATCDDTDAVAVAVVELVAQADPRQQSPL